MLITWRAQALLSRGFFSWLGWALLKKYNESVRSGSSMHCMHCLWIYLLFLYVTSYINKGEKEISKALQEVYQIQCRNSTFDAFDMLESMVTSQYSSSAILSFQHTILVCIICNSRWVLPITIAEIIQTTRSIQVKVNANAKDHEMSLLTTNWSLISGYLIPASSLCLQHLILSRVQSISIIATPEKEHSLDMYLRKGDHTELCKTI